MFKCEAPGCVHKNRKSLGYNVEEEREIYDIVNDGMTRPGEKMHRVVTHTRPAAYNSQEFERGRGRWIKDPGGQGIEIVKEIKVCSAGLAMLENQGFKPSVVKNQKEAVYRMLDWFETPTWQKESNA